MKAFDDIALVTQVAVLHNRRAFDQLVVKYQSSIQRFFLLQTGGDVALSDDLAQETFVKAYVNITHFRGLSRFSTWLYRIAYNTFYDDVRRRKITEDVDTSAAAQHRSETLHTGLRLDLQQAMQVLSANERLCITLQLVDGQSIEQIAAITGMAQGTIKSHLSRGKKKLTAYLKQNGYDG